MVARCYDGGVSSIIDETAGRVRLAPLTVEQYEAMIAQGILPEGEPIELIDGLLVAKDRAAAGEDPMTAGPGHQLAVKKLTRLAPRFESLGCHLSIQGPIRLPPRDEPEPDAAVVAGAPEDYAERHPGPAEVWAVVEVSDSSLARDRTTKRRVYAAAGVAQYVIVNLVDRCVEVHEVPIPAEGRYARGPVVRRGDDEVRVAAGPAGSDREVVVTAGELLP